MKYDSMMKALSDLSKEELKELYDNRARRKRRAVARTGREGRRQLVAMLETLAPKVYKQKYKPRPHKVRIPLMKRRGVGKFICAQLSVVIGRTPDGFPIGLSYEKILMATLTEFPESAADELHMRWYANRMRARGHMIPVYRARSNWQ